MTKATGARLVVPKSAAKSADVFNAVGVLSQILDAAQDYLIVRETEATKQEAIRARKEVDLSEIHAKRELFLTYLHRSFDERRKNFKELRTRIIEPAVKELRQKDNWLIEWEPIKAGRRVSALSFRFARNPQQSLI